MTQVLTLAGITPPARYDDLAWTIGRIEESTSESGSYTLLQEVDLDPVDDDPTDPQPRSFTTELATVGNWYRVVFEDADGDQSAPTAPVEFIDQAVAAYANAAELAGILKVNATTNATRLDRVLLMAAGEINSEIGRTDLAGWERALAEEVNLDRTIEIWHETPLSFSVIGLDTEGPIRLSRDTWDRHANKLAPLKGSWGIA